MKHPVYKNRKRGWRTLNVYRKHRDDNTQVLCSPRGIHVNFHDSEMYVALPLDHLEARSQLLYLNSILWYYTSSTTGIIVAY
jgi:hypothetical protein